MLGPSVRGGSRIAPCACGCGKEIRNRKGGRPREYYDGACRVRAYRQREDVTVDAPGQTTHGPEESLQPDTAPAEAPRFVEIHNFRGHGLKYGYTGPFAGIRTVRVIEDLGEHLRIRYLGPDPMEEIVPAERVVREFVSDSYKGAVRSGRE